MLGRADGLQTGPLTLIWIQLQACRYDVLFVSSRVSVSAAARHPACCTTRFLFLHFVSIFAWPACICEIQYSDLWVYLKPRTASASPISRLTPVSSLEAVNHVVVLPHQVISNLQLRADSQDTTNYSHYWLITQWFVLSNSSKSFIYYNSLTTVWWPHWQKLGLTSKFFLPDSDTNALFYREPGEPHPCVFILPDVYDSTNAIKSTRQAHAVRFRSKWSV